MLCRYYYVTIICVGWHGELENSDSKYETMFDDGAFASLRINRLTYEDAGQYSFQITTVYSYEFYLVVIGKVFNAIVAAMISMNPVLFQCNL